MDLQEEKYLEQAFEILGRARDRRVLFVYYKSILARVLLHTRVCARTHTHIHTHTHTHTHTSASWG